MTYDSFLLDHKTQDAVIRNLEIIGEATRNLSETFRTKQSDIPWRSLAGIRNKLIHQYFGVNLDIVCQVAIIELPKVASRLKEIPDEELPIE